MKKEGAEHAWSNEINSAGGGGTGIAGGWDVAMAMINCPPRWGCMTVVGTRVARDHKQVLRSHGGHID